MKKIWTRFLALGCILVCMLTLTVYTAKTEAASLEYDESSLSDFIDQIISVMKTDQYSDYYLSMDDSELDTQLEGAGISAKVLKGALQSFQDAADKYGEYKGKSDYKFSATDKTVTMTATLKFKEHNVNMKVDYDEDLNIDSITFNKQNVFAELIERAGTGGIIGAGIVIVILGVILGFALGKRNQNNQEDSAVISDNNEGAAAVDAVQTVDSTELIAVITAAVAVSMGTTSADGFIVRSIKKRRR